jgi:transmembrane sensor
MYKSINIQPPLYKRTWFLTVSAIILLLGLWLLFMGPKSFSVPEGSTLAITLPDGTGAVLYNGASISYNSRNWDSKRELELEGEAYFKVANGKTFTVATPQGTVTVLGTKFKIKSAKGFFNVSCYKGKVNVVHKKREFILTDMQGITFTNDNDTGVQEVKEPQPLWLFQ